MGLYDAMVWSVENVGLSGRKRSKLHPIAIKKRELLPYGSSHVSTTLMCLCFLYVAFQTYPLIFENRRGLINLLCDFTRTDPYAMANETSSKVVPMCRHTRGLHVTSRQTQFRALLGHLYIKFDKINATMRLSAPNCIYFVAFKRFLFSCIRSIVLSSSGPLLCPVLDHFNIAFGACLFFFLNI